MAAERLPGHQRSRQLECHEGLAATPLAGHQPMGRGRHQSFDQPRLERPRIGVPVCVQRRQPEIRLRGGLLIVFQVIIEIVVELFLKIILCGRGLLLLRLWFRG